jgi:hypothetical protein
MTVDGQTLSKPLHIALPPNAHGSEADIMASVKLQLKVREDIGTVSDMTNQLEWMRRQIEDQSKAAQGKADLLKAMDTIDKKMKAVELNLVTESEMLSDDKYFPEQDKLYLTLVWLNGEIGGGGGDVAGTGDYGATETDTALVLDLEKQLQTVQTEYKNLMGKDIPAYNQTVSGSGVAPLKTTGAPPAPIRPGGRGGGDGDNN